MCPQTPQTTAPSVPRVAGSPSPHGSRLVRNGGKPPHHTEKRAGTPLFRSRKNGRKAPSPHHSRLVRKGRKSSPLMEKGRETPLRPRKKEGKPSPPLLMEKGGKLPLTEKGRKPLHPSSLPRCAAKKRHGSPPSPHKKKPAGNPHAIPAPRMRSAKRSPPPRAPCPHASRQAHAHYTSRPPQPPPLRPHRSRRVRSSFLLRFLPGLSPARSGIAAGGGGERAERGGRL